MARKQRVQKTNAMRELERGGVAYEAIEFDEPDPTSVSDLGETAQLFDDIYISGGRLGLTLKLAPDELAAFLGATLADICRS